MSIEETATNRELGIWVVSGILLVFLTFNAVGLVFGLLLTIGCGPPVPKEDLGTIDKTLPNPPGTEKPYKIRQLERSAEPAFGNAAANPE